MGIVYFEVSPTVKVVIVAVPVVLYPVAETTPEVFTWVIFEFPNWIVLLVLTEALDPSAIEFATEGEVMSASYPIAIFCPPLLVEFKAW